MLRHVDRHACQCLLAQRDGRMCTETDALNEQDGLIGRSHRRRYRGLVRGIPIAISLSADRGHGCCQINTTAAVLCSNEGIGAP